MHMGHVVMIISREHRAMLDHSQNCIARNSVWHKISWPLTNSEVFLHGGCGTDAFFWGGGVVCIAPLPPLKVNI